jgi:hypothetical protein
MRVSGFETRLERAMLEKKDALMSVPDDQGFRAARIRGQHQGLQEALSLYRELGRLDDDRDEL